jgi:hypothetical protein
MARARADSRRGTIERGAGLAEIGFPHGVFNEANLGPGIGPRSIWRDSVLVDIMAAYPDLLPPSEATDILERASRKVRWFPFPSPWDTHRPPKD